MFCSNCGKELNVEKKFCNYCGAKNNDYYYEKNNDDKTHLNVSESKNSLSVFNRDVLINYLNNIQILEFAKHKMETDKNEFETYLNDLKNRNYSVRPATDASEDTAVVFIPLIVLIIFVSFLKICERNNNFLQSISFLITIALIILIGILVILIYSCISETNRDEERYKDEVAYQNKCKSEDDETKEYLELAIPVVECELNETLFLLNEAYDINIIPAKYRNLYGAYFLYEYISTSYTTLEDALYHCDLDEISKKLDVVIEQQQEIIMELARSNALNEQIINQNEQILRHAIATENNTALAAQYSQVAAVNTKTISQIQSYYFFEKGL